MMQPSNGNNFKEVLGPQARAAGAIEDKGQVVQSFLEQHCSPLQFQIAGINTSIHELNRTATENLPPGCKEASKLSRGWPTGGCKCPPAGGVCGECRSAQLPRTRPSRQGGQHRPSTGCLPAAPAPPHSSYLGSPPLAARRPTAAHCSQQGSSVLNRPGRRRNTDAPQRPELAAWPSPSHRLLLVIFGFCHRAVK